MRVFDGVGELPEAVLCAGLYRSGSTWTFNVAARLFRLRFPAKHIVAIYTDDLGEIEESAMQDADCLVLKAHKPAPAVRSLARISGMPVLLTSRDPRDAVASLMMQFKLDFVSALAWVEASSHALIPLLRQPNTLLLRYEDGFTSKLESVEAIARCLGVPLTTAERDTLFAAFTPGAVSATIAELQARGAFADVSPADTWDQDTHWHPSHVGDGRIGKWPEVLTEAEAARVSYATRRFRTTFGYENGSPLASGTELDFSLHGTGASYLEDGFSEVEEGGIWTAADTATLRLRLQGVIDTALHLELLCSLGGVALRTDLPHGSVRLMLNGRLMSELRASASNPTHVLFAFQLEGESVAGRDEVELRFESKGLVSPAECGQGSDLRRLGLSLIWMRLRFNGAH